MDKISIIRPGLTFITSEGKAIRQGKVPCQPGGAYDTADIANVLSNLKAQFKTKDGTELILCSVLCETSDDGYHTVTVGPVPSSLNCSDSESSNTNGGGGGGEMMAEENQKKFKILLDGDDVSKRAMHSGMGHVHSNPVPFLNGSCLSLIEIGTVTNPILSRITLRFINPLERMSINSLLASTSYELGDGESSLTTSHRFDINPNVVTSTSGAGSIAVTGEDRHLQRGMAGESGALTGGLAKRAFDSSTLSLFDIAKDDIDGFSSTTGSMAPTDDVDFHSDTTSIEGSIRFDHRERKRASERVKRDTCDVLFSILRICIQNQIKMLRRPRVEQIYYCTPYFAAI